MGKVPEPAVEVVEVEVAAQVRAGAALDVRTGCVDPMRQRHFLQSRSSARSASARSASARYAVCAYSQVALDLMGARSSSQSSHLLLALCHLLRWA